MTILKQPTAQSPGSTAKNLTAKQSKSKWPQSKLHPLEASVHQEVVVVVDLAAEEAVGTLEEVVEAVVTATLETVTAAVVAEEVVAAELKPTSQLVPEIGNVQSLTVATQTFHGEMNATNAKHPNLPELVAVTAKTVVDVAVDLEAEVAAVVAMAIVTVVAAEEALVVTEEAALEATDVEVASEVAEVETVALVAVEVAVTAAVQCVVVAEAVIASVLIRYPFLFCFASLQSITYLDGDTNAVILEFKNP